MRSSKKTTFHQRVFMVLVVIAGVMTHNPHALWAEWNYFTRSNSQELNLYSLQRLAQNMTIAQVTSETGNAWMAIEEKAPVDMLAHEGGNNFLPFLSQAASSLYGTLQSE